MGLKERRNTGLTDRLNRKKYILKRRARRRKK